VGEVKIPVSDGEIPGYRASPPRGLPFATILVVQEVFGVMSISGHLPAPGQGRLFRRRPGFYARQAMSRR
jgi:dienelactone hydrolase